MLQDFPVSISFLNNPFAHYGFQPTIVNPPENGSLNQWIYTPHTNYNGFDRIGYTWQSNDIQEAIIYIKPVNDAPQILETTPDQLELDEDYTAKLHVNAY